MPDSPVIIRPLERYDLDLIAEWRQSSAAISSFFSPEPVTSSGQYLWYESYLKKPTDMMFVIVTSDGAPVGTIGLVDIDYRNQKAEYARLLVGDASSRRKGVAEFASRQLLDLASSQLHLTKVYLEVFESNHAAINLYNKLGFEIEGHYRREVFSRGEWQDVLRMCIFLDASRGE